MANYNYSAKEYADAFEKIGLTKYQKRILVAHYNAPDKTITATGLAKALNFKRFNASNLKYGEIGSKVCEILKPSRIGEKIGILVEFDKRNDEWHWIMRPGVIEAIEMLGLVDTVYFKLPEEITNNGDKEHFEGARVQVYVNKYERDPEARKRCLEKHGYRCKVCDALLADIYGEIGEDFIHVHHLRPLSEIGKQYKIDPIKELIPVCPNCHAMIHKKNDPPYSVQEIQKFIKKKSK